MIHLINAKIYETKLKCDYCDHSKIQKQQHISNYKDKSKAYDLKNMPYETVGREPTFMSNKL